MGREQAFYKLTKENQILSKRLLNEIYTRRKKDFRWLNIELWLTHAHQSYTVNWLIYSIFPLFHFQLCEIEAFHLVSHALNNGKSLQEHWKRIAWVIPSFFFTQNQWISNFFCSFSSFITYILFSIVQQISP